MKNKLTVLISLIIGVLSFSCVSMADTSGIDGFYVPPSQKKVQVAKPKLAVTTQATVITLPMLPAGAKTTQTRGKNSPVMVGVERELPAPYTKGLTSIRLNWKPTNDGGHAAVVRFVDNTASAMRIGLEINKITKGTELRFYGSGNQAQVYGPFPEKGDDISFDELGGLFWSPVVDGNTINLEIYLPPGLTIDQAPVIHRIKTSHLWTSAGNGFKRLSDIGRSGACNIDLACQSNWSRVGASEAKIVFQVNDATFLCSGTLLNDSDAATSVPYFLTAHHCVSTAAAAASITAFWNFQRATCGGANPTSVTQTSGGAILLATSPTDDMTLVRMNATPPGGVFYAGWSAVANSNNLAVTGIHHPAGDLKKISNGNTSAGYYTWRGNRVFANANGHHVAVTWRNGTTEGGSSGSGLFNDANGRLIGTLTGGGASCTNPTSPDYYGRFATFLPQVRNYLAQTTTLSIMTNPAPDSTLTSATVAFRWTNVGAVQYYLYIGTTRGGRQIYSGNQGRATSRVVSGLPTNGSTIYVRLWTRTAAGWRYHDYTYQAGRTDDHGNSTATATAIALPSTTAGVINYAGDNDYFRVVVPSSGVLTVNTTGATDTFGYLLSSTGRIIASNDDAGGALRTNFRISRTVTAGTYYIRVRHFSNTGTGAYHLVSNFTTGGTGVISVMTSPTPGSTRAIALKFWPAGLRNLYYL